MKLTSHLTAVGAYLLVIAFAFSLATVSMRAQDEETPLRPPLEVERESPPPETDVTPAHPEASPTPLNPRFTLSTYRVYATHEKARIWVSYQDVDSLDFRVYQVNDPSEFFRQLDNVHQMGEEESGEAGDLAAEAARHPSFLERIHKFKSEVSRSAKRYVRKQLRKQSRVSFNDKFRSGDQLPLNAADFARVPLLNSAELTLRGAWKQTLAPLNGEYESRMVSLGKREPGVYLIEAVHSGAGGELRAYTVSVVSDLMLIYKTAPGGQLIVYLADRNSGEPRGGGAVEIVRDKDTINSGKTDQQGLFKTQIANRRRPTSLIPQRFLEDEPSDEQEDEWGDQAAEEEFTEEWDSTEPSLIAAPRKLIVMAEFDGQFTISDLSFGGFNRFTPVRSGSITGDNLKSYIYTDRPIYRPGERAYFKGIVRKTGEAGYELPAERAVAVRVTDPNDEVILIKEFSLSAQGTFAGEVDLPRELPRGQCTITTKIGKGFARAYFEVFDYQKPPFKARVATAKKFAPAGEKITFKVEAQLYTGAPLANGDVTYYIYRSPYRYPWDENVDDAALIGPPESSEEEDEESDESEYGYNHDLVKEGQTRLDMHGRIEIPFILPKANPQETTDFSYRIEVRVSDLSDSEIIAKASVVAVRSNVVVDATAENKIVKAGEQTRIKVKTVDYEGRPVAARVTLKFIEQTSEPVEAEPGVAGKSGRPEYRQRESELGTAEVVTDAQGEAFYSWRAPAPGHFLIRIILREGEKEFNLPGGEIWAADRDNRWTEFATVNEGSIKLIPDKPFYQPGDKARVLAVLPTAGAHLLVTTELNSLIDVWRVDASEHAVTIEVPIERRHAPNVYLSVCYVKDGEMYTADKALAIPARDKFLKLEISADKDEYRPRDPAEYVVVARSSDGSPAAGVEVSLGVVDEAVYGVSERARVDNNIRRRFYSYQPHRVETSFSSGFTFTGYSDAKLFELAQRKRPFQLADFKNENEIGQPKIRKEFKDTAFWQPDLITDAKGEARVRLNLPDNQTLWRATAFAVTSDLKVGSKTAKVVSRNPLMIRLETPGVITEGDTVAVSAIVHNYRAQGQAAEVELQVSGATLLDQAKQTVNVVRKASQRVDWRITAAQSGSILLRAVAKAGEESDGVQLSLPIAPSGLKRTIGESAAIGDENGEKTLTLNLPPAANPLRRSLRITAAPSLAGVISEAVDYLKNYPYRGAEQSISVNLPQLVASRALGKRLGKSTGGQNDDEDQGYELYHLSQLQHPRGGFGWWIGDQLDPFMTAYVIDGLAMARREGQDDHSYLITSGRQKIAELLNTGKIDEQPIDLESRAYLVYAYTASVKPPSAFLSSPRRGATRPIRPIPPPVSPQYESGQSITRPPLVERSSAQVLPSRPTQPVAAGPSGSAPRIVPSAPSSTSPASIAREVEMVRYNFSATIGLWMNRDGSYEVIGQRQPSADEKKMIDALGKLQKSLQEFNPSLNDSSALRANVLRLREDVMEVQQTWTRLRMSAELNSQIRKLIFESMEMTERALPAPTRPPLPQTSDAVRPQPGQPLTAPRPIASNPPVIPRPTPASQESVPAPQSRPRVTRPTPLLDPRAEPAAAPGAQYTVQPTPYPVRPVVPQERYLPPPPRLVQPPIVRPVERPRPLDSDGLEDLPTRYPRPSQRAASGSAQQRQASLKRQIRYVNELYARRSELQPYGKALLALSLDLIGESDRARQVLSDLESLARTTNEEAHWESTRHPAPGVVENNDLEATALAVRALAKLSPQSPLLGKAVRWIVAARRHGSYWESTRQTAFAIFALLDYLQVSQDPPPNYSFEVYLNGRPVLAKQMTGVEAADGGTFVIENKDSQVNGSNQIHVVKRGSGLLYVSATLDYLANDENLASGIKLTRDYLRLQVRETGGRPQWTVEPLAGDLRPGDLIVSRLKVQGAGGRYLMIEDPIPAGCEPLPSEDFIDPGRPSRNWGDRYSAREFNNRRTVIFQQSFDGDETYQYALRVQAPGEFKVAPARVEMIYQPTIQASTEMKKVKILGPK